MTSRTRRLLGAAVVLVLLLFAGRWSVELLAERWWAATIAPSAATFVTRWRLLGVGLDAAAMVIAAIWFALQALLVARAIASVQVTRRLGNLQLREAVPTRLLLAGAVGSGILLGLIAGAGAHEWRDPMLLSAQGVRYGLTDPLLNLDVGVYVSQLPVWDLLHRFATLLVFLGLLFCVMLYASIGAMSRDQQRVSVHADARRHLGVLLGLAALTIAMGYRLAPYHIAAAAIPALTAAGALSRVHAADILSGVAAATAVLSLVWALRGRNTLLVAAWVVLAVASIGERYAVPALVEEGPPGPGRLAVTRRFDAVAWGVRESATPTEPDAVPSTTAIWDEQLLARLVDADGGVMDAATPQALGGSGRSPLAAWLVAMQSTANPSQLDLLAVTDGVIGPSGAPRMVPAPGAVDSSQFPWRVVRGARVHPGAPSWRSVRTGVDASTPLRRLLLAWARQAPGILGNNAPGSMDWHLDPTDRARAVLPMADWQDADLVIVNSRPAWVVQGLLPIAEFPLTTRADWGDSRVAGLVPAFLCVVDPVTGETRFYLDPGADSLGVAWARAIGPLVEPAPAIPGDLRRALTYPVAWFEAQLQVLQAAAWGGGTMPRPGPHRGVTAPVWLAGTIPARQAALEAGDRSGIATVATVWRASGVPAMHLDRRNGDGDLPSNRLELRQLWSRAAVLLHLRDSVTAAGDTTWARAPRWSPGTDGVAWEPVFAVPARGVPALLWIATGLNEQLGGGESAAAAWRSVTQPGAASAPTGPDNATALDQARRSLQQADSALRRGDMTAFGRAFEELRRVLKPVAH